MRKLAALLWVALLLSLGASPALATGSYWAKTYGGSDSDGANAVAVAPNGDIIVAGTTGSTGAGGYDAFVARLSPDGELKWFKTYGGKYDDVANAVAVDGNDIIVTGYTKSFGAGIPYYSNVWVLRLDSNGNVIWQKTYGGSGDDVASAVAVDGNDIIVTGYTRSFGAGDRDAWVLRLDENGNIKWQKTYGGKWWDVVNAVALAPNGDIIVAGGTYSFGVNGDVWVLRLDSNGNVIWQKTYGGWVNDEASAVAVDGNDIIVAGYTKSFGAGKDVWVLKLDSQGNVIWQKTYGGIGDDEARAVAIAPNGGIIVAGGTYSFGVGEDEAWVLRLDSNGNVIWQKTYGGWDNDEASAVAVDGNDIIVTGYTRSFGAGDRDAWVLRLPPDGNLPGCKFCSNSNARVTVPTAQVGNSDANVSNSDATVQNSDAVVKTWNPTVEMQYPVFGHLSVSSSPSGAKVYVNGTYEGITPLTLNLTPGTYTVKLVLRGYKNYTKTVTVTAGEKTSLSASLTPLPSSTSTSSSSMTSTSSTSSAVVSTSSPSSTVTPVAQTSGGLNYAYVLIALVGLAVIGGLAAKTRRKPKPPASGASSPKPRVSPEKPKVERGRKREAAGSGKIKEAPKTAPPRTEKPGEEKPKIEEKPPVPGFPSALLGRYEPLEFLGEGGFAKVFKARRKKDGKVVALKIPRMDERTSKTFIKEVSAWLHLNHENIVKLHDVDILPIPYLEMEFVEGVEVGGKVVRDLDGYPKPVPEKTALELIRGIAGGLAHAHSKGIYHRDLKPKNVLLKSDLTPKITDWGLAKLGTVSSSRSVLGYTPLYASPEHLLPSRYGHTDHRTDIWQLGVTFYELLTGRLPFEGYTYEELFGKIVDENYRFRPPSSFNPDLAKYDGIFERLLAKRKEDRYQSVEEFLDALEKVEESERRKAELEREVERLKKTLARSVSALKESRTAEEAVRNRKLVVESLGKLALAYAELNRKAELLNTLNDLKFYTVRNLADLTNAINTVEALLKENLLVGGDFVERLKVLVHNVMRENGV